jgi:hypothetical protein
VTGQGDRRPPIALYLQHDAKEATLAAYGKNIIPAF